MRKIQQTRYTIKHKSTSAFHPGNKVPEVAKMPAYNSASKPYVRKLPAMRDKRIIDISLLAAIMNRITPGNSIELSGEGLIINKTEISIGTGIASTKHMKFRFLDLRDLLDQFLQEGILICNKLDLRVIKDRYFKALNDSKC
ncbi:MAG TPA: hypothetical protein VIK14_16335 [Ignavibacteria bacterium]